jgi:hypothetical protein
MSGDILRPSMPITLAKVSAITLLAYELLGLGGISTATH